MYFSFYRGDLRCFPNVLSYQVPESAMQTDDPTKKPNSIKHYIIRHSKENNTYFIRQQMPFNSIAELLEFFKNNRGFLSVCFSVFVSVSLSFLSVFVCHVSCFVYICPFYLLLLVVVLFIICFVVSRIFFYLQLSIIMY